MANKTVSISLNYGDFCVVALLGLSAMWFVAGIASLVVDLGGWQIWGRVALTQALLFAAATLAFVGAGARRGSAGVGDQATRS